MILIHENKTYSKGSNEPKQVRNVSATNKVIRTANALRCVESEMMSFAYKLGRSENQREERINKRKN